MVKDLVVVWQLPSSCLEAVLNLLLKAQMWARMGVSVLLVLLKIQEGLVSLISHVGRQMTKVHRWLLW